MTTPCAERYCQHHADIRTAVRAICARHYNAEVAELGARP